MGRRLCRESASDRRPLVQVRCRFTCLFPCAYSFIHTMTASSIDSLPAELLTLVMLHAQRNDLQARSTSACKAMVDSRQQQELQQQQTYVHANSALQLSRTSNKLYAASVSVVYEVSGGARLRTRWNRGQQQSVRGPPCEDMD